MHYKVVSTKTLFFTGVCVFLTYFILTNNYTFQRSNYKQKMGTDGVLPRFSNIASKSPGDPRLSYTAPKPRPQRQSLIILTYMRSGSSLLGDIIQQSPGSFYLYEPLHSLGRIYTHFKTNLTFVNGTERMWPFNYLEEAVNIIRFWLKCDTTKVLRKGLRDGFMEKGVSSGGFRACYRELSRRMENDTTRLYMKCALKVREKCERSHLRVMKTIRISMRAISRLMDEFPELKIIHLIRDARATLTSQSNFGLCAGGHGGYEGCSNRFCTRLENDILESEILQKKYPKRIKTVFYENIAMNPIAASKDLYQFLGTAFTSHVKNYVFNITQAGKADNCAICTTRQNSSIHIDSWRNKLKEKNLQIIEQRCNYVLQRFNYTLYSNDSFFV